MTLTFTKVIFSWSICTFTQVWFSSTLNNTARLEFRCACVCSLHTGGSECTNSGRHTTMLFVCSRIKLYASRGRRDAWFSAGRWCLHIVVVVRRQRNTFAFLCYGRGSIHWMDPVVMGGVCRGGRWASIDDWREPMYLLLSGMGGGCWVLHSAPRRFFGGTVKHFNRNTKGPRSGGWETLG